MVRIDWASSSLASLAALRAALGWYAATLARAPGAPFDAERAQEIQRALEDCAPCDPALFDQLLTLGRLMHRLAGRNGAPICNVADVLVATSGLPACGVHPRWERTTRVDEATFAKLGFSATSKGIADAHQNNRAAWRNHLESCRSFILAAARGASKGSAVVVGVGRAFDLPLAELAQGFDRLVLIDIDPQALETTAAALRESRPHAQIETRAIDLTAVSRTMVATLDELIRGDDVPAIQVGIEGFVRSYRPVPIHWLEPGDSCDLLVSSCVVSQLAWPQRAYALERLQKIGPVVGEAERTWSRAWFELELRVQQDHIRACVDTAGVTAFISDMANRLTAFDESGLERPTGQKVFTLGVDSLWERIPQAIRGERHASWLWPRHRPGSLDEPGSWTETEALVLYDRSKVIA